MKIENQNRRWRMENVKYEFTSTESGWACLWMNMGRIQKKKRRWEKQWEKVGEGTGIGEEKVAEEEMDEFIWRRKGIARVGEGRKSKVRERLLFFHKIKLLKKN